MDWLEKITLTIKFISYEVKKTNKNELKITELIHKIKTNESKRRVIVKKIKGL